MEKIRPNPDLILSRLLQEEDKVKRGNFRLFFGMAAGVGKTYAMLGAAHQRLKEGVDVRIGFLETHGRVETEKRMQGIPIIPRKIIDYRGTPQEEMDLDAILSLKPSLVLVDELAHTNVQGSRHEKRYQDVLEILEAGIDVYSTLNVQHLESRADVVSLVTAAQVRETLPDSILDYVDQIELIDITPQQLIERLEEGKIYPGRKAEQALQYFFQESNLNVLREIALRVTANKVERDSREKRQSGSSWNSTSPRKLLVAVSHSPFSERLIRTARRLVEDLEIPWIVAHVDTGQILSSENQNQLVKNLNLAAELGAETVSLHGAHVGETLNDYVREHQVVQVILGRPLKKGRWWNFFKSSRFIEELIRKNPNVDITLLQQGGASEPKRKYVERSEGRFDWFGLFQAFFWVFFTSFMAYYLNPYLGYRATGFVFLFLVVVLSVFFRFGIVLTSATLSALIWNYFFIPPLMTFSINAPEDFMMFLAYFFIASASGFLTFQIKRNQKILKDREEKTRALYEVLKSMTLVQDTPTLVDLALSKIRELFKAECCILLYKEGALEKKPSYGSVLLSENDYAVATWSYDHGRMAGWSTDTLPLSPVFCLSLKSREKKFGVLVFRPTVDKKLNPDQQNLLISIANQVGVVLAKQEHDQEVQDSQLLKESEKLHQALLNCVSHELRTPLTTIMGAASALQKDNSSSAILSEEIISAAEKLNHIFENLLDLTRLESGVIKPKQEWFDLSELIQEALNRQKKLAIKHQIIFEEPSEAFYFFGDFDLLEHAFTNLLLNALHYSPAHSTIHVKLYEQGFQSLISVSDEGPGIPADILPKVFEKFYRLPNSPGAGLGLGLSISKNFVELNQGSIEARNNPSAGATFTIHLPKQKMPEALRSLSRERS